MLGDGGGFQQGLACLVAVVDWSAFPAGYAYPHRGYAAFAGIVRLRARGYDAVQRDYGAVDGGFRRGWFHALAGGGQSQQADGVGLAGVASVVQQRLVQHQ